MCKSIHLNFTDEKLNTEYCFEVVLSRGLKREALRASLAKLGGPREAEKKSVGFFQNGSGCSLGYSWAPHAEPQAGPVGNGGGDEKQNPSYSIKNGPGCSLRYSWACRGSQASRRNCITTRLKLANQDSHPFTCHFRLNIRTRFH